MITRSPSSTPWHALSAEQALQQLAADAGRGLSGAEAERRLAEYGYNRLPPPKRRPAWLRFLLQFHNLLIYVLLAAAAVTAWLQDYVDTAVIVAVVVLNALIGYIQEGKAESALEAVRNLLSPTAMVLRDGRRWTVEAETLVPGDMVLLQSGDKVPADLRVVEARTLRIDESVLTGESVPVEKSSQPTAAESPLGDRLGMAHSGTLVTYGQGLAVVVATGSATAIGRISTLLAEVGGLETPLLRKIDQFTRWLTFIILGVASVTFLFGWLARGLGAQELFMAAVGLAVAAIPEGLPAIVTITLAVGVQAMAKRQAILRQLPAVETLGSVTVICTDKTGTLTRNEMTVQTVATAAAEFQVSGVGYDPHGGFSLGQVAAAAADAPDLLELARAALLCNDAAVARDNGDWRLEGDPTEGSLVVLALKAGLDAAFENKELPRLDAIPFESEHRFMATLHRDHAGHRWIYLKGAPEVVLERCHRQRRAGDDEPLDPALWQGYIQDIAARGQRLIALAVKPLEQAADSLQFVDTDGGFTLLGIAGMIDPPRPEAVAAVARCQSAGIRVKMITGDHAATARAIGAQLGIGGGDRVLTGGDIERLSDQALQQAVGEVDVFARANPEHKLRLVAALRATGQVVSMTGDGVNDAPALKAADIGVAMGKRGTEAAKEAAEMVLADDNFATIASAVEEGRTVYDNLRKAIMFALPTNGGQAAVIIAAILLGQPLPITPLQVLWVNLVIAVTLALSLAFEPAEGDIMRRPPRSPAEPLVTRHMLWRIVFVSLLLVVATLGLYQWEIAHGAAVELARSAAVNVLVAGQMVYLVNSRYFFASSLGWRAWFGSRYAVLAMAVLIAVQLLFTYAPFMQQAFHSRALDGDAWLRIGLAAVSIFTAVEAEKALLRRWRQPSPAAADPERWNVWTLAGAALNTVLAMLVLAQFGRVAATLYDLWPATGTGWWMAVTAAALALSLWGEAAWAIAARRTAPAALTLLASALLLAAAWHAPAYPFAAEQLPWVVAGCAALLVAGVAYLALSLALRRSGG
ncbi:cation-transporting P-type ATPase [Methylogaea oryzae]|uniref:Cation-transporting P-type ATPase n=1 Tax=Methylogaea oryzae TaxID=1295382 RepID=A0A8D5AGM6_9GAMM|nr:cation-transporting P-type ATPase [Methylogaea oryzae]BBL70543.1 cation-transporting P-type ATPase [Methylogaea oryzae]